MSDMWKKLKASKAMRFVKIVSESASLALFLSIIFFAYEMVENMQESKEMTDNLVKIQNSLTTKHLGIFPNYLPSINDLFREATPGDSIIIFEDVLYYGFRSKPDEFKSYNRHLLELRNGGSHVIVAYYDPNGIAFHQMVQENRFGSQLAAFQHERKIVFDSLMLLAKNNITVNIAREDSILSEKYFELERTANPRKFERIVRAYLKPITSENDTQERRSDQDIYSTCRKIDAIKEAYLNKKIEDITFFDFENMFAEITKEIELLYSSYGFECIPLNDNLIMSCWMSGEKMIFAFPSKYNTDEIGFSSQDPAFSKYIRTMLRGVRQ
ncbi:MAG: hypothetical protein UHJ11_01580 [Paludibacteraceae bacterium]|nr:hypothetical protein [Paludibacteraceae bacterium]